MGPANSDVSQRGLELILSVLTGSSGKERWLLPDLLKFTGTAIESIVLSV